LGTGGVGVVVHEAVGHEHGVPAVGDAVLAHPLGAAVEVGGGVISHISAELIRHRFRVSLGSKVLSDR